MKDIVIEEPTEFFVEKDHYLINGKPFYRVTQIKNIIKNQGLINWQVSIGKKKAYEIMKKRASFGSKQHKLFQLKLDGATINPNHYDDDTKDIQMKFDTFMSKHKAAPLFLEQHLWSERYQYAGTADFIGYLDGKLTIIDWKTSKAIYPEFWLQLSAYLYAFEELTGKKIEQCAILKIRENQKIDFQTKTRDEMLKQFDVFKSCITIFLWQKGCG